MGLLENAAEAWKQIENFRYEIIGAKKKKKYELQIIFDDFDFHHLAGFQYTKDIRGIYITSKRHTLQAVIDKKITTQSIIKSTNYENMIKPRLIALCELEAVLDNDFQIFKPVFNNMYTITTEIQCDFFIHGKGKNNVSFFFVSRHNQDESSVENSCYGKSIFIEDPMRDYTKGQSPLCILHKVKHNITNGTKLEYVKRIDL